MVEYLEDDEYEFVDRPLPWQRLGLQQTTSGYGARLTSTRCIRLLTSGQLRRVYVTQYGNAADKTQIT